MTLLSGEPPAQAITVLLVEDDAPTSWRLQDALAKAGYQVRTAATLAEARACLSEGAPRVLLTDLQLPDGHGVALPWRSAAADAIDRTAAARDLAQSSPNNLMRGISTRAGSVA